MNAQEWCWLLLLAMAMGVIGQTARTAIGLKKLHEKDPLKFKEDFSWPKIFISYSLGIAASVLAALLNWEESFAGRIDTDGLLMLAAAGYAGSDLIEGLMERKLKAMGAT
jgi:uncharacterized membrane protein YbhN (UPF0104 family)